MWRAAWHVVVFWGVLAPPALLGQEGSFDSNGVPIRYLERGRGEPIILVHGYAGRLEAWTQSGVVGNLARDYRVVAYDARGHGKSGKPHDPKLYGRELALDLVRLLDHLGIDRAHLIGYSMGGQTVAQLLTLHPDRFLTATLVAAAGRFDWTPAEAQETEQEAIEMERECVSRTLLNRLAPPDGPKPSEQAIKAISAACLANPEQDRFALAAVRRSYADQVITPDQVSAVRVPTLGVVGSRDEARASLERLKRLRPGITLVVVEGATHGGERGIVGRPELVAAIREFLAASRTSSPQSTNPARGRAWSVDW